MRVCLFVYKPLVVNAQVFREASALVERGDTVEILAFHRDDLPAVEERDGYTIHRIRRDPLDQRLKRLARTLRRRIARLPGDVARRLVPSLRERWPAPSQPGRRTGAVSKPRPRGFIRKQLQLLDYSIKAYRIVKERPADVYHALNLDTLPLGVAAARRSGARLVYDSRELWADRAVVPGLQKRYWWFIEGRLIDRPDRILTPCDSFSDQLVKRHGIEKPAVVRSCPVIPEGGLNGGGPELREYASLEGSDEPIVLYQGQIQAERGLYDLATAAGQLERGVVVIMGSGSMRGELQRTVDTAGLTERIRILEAVPPELLLRYTAGATIGVAPIEGNHLSYFYSAPNKLYEYLAAGLPVVATRLPEMEQVVEGHDVGLLVEPGDVQGLAAAINRLLAEPELYGRFRKNALEASKIFNWNTESAKFRALYDSLESAPS